MVRLKGIEKMEFKLSNGMEFIAINNVMKEKYENLASQLMDNNASLFGKITLKYFEKVYQLDNRYCFVISTTVEHAVFIRNIVEMETVHLK